MIIIDNPDSLSCKVWIADPNYEPQPNQSVVQSATEMTFNYQIFAYLNDVAFPLIKDPKDMYISELAVASYDDKTYHLREQMGVREYTLTVLERVGGVNVCRETYTIRPRVVELNGIPIDKRRAREVLLTAIRVVDRHGLENVSGYAPL